MNKIFPQFEILLYPKKKKKKKLWFKELRWKIEMFLLI